MRNGEMMAVFFIDLDHFKMVNDNLGHAAGDAMLQEVASRLKSFAGEPETLARAAVMSSSIWQACRQQRPLQRWPQG